MAELTINGKTTVKELQTQFENEIGGHLRVYDGRSEAPEDATLVSIGAKKGVFECRTSRTVGKFEEAVLAELNLKVKVYTRDNWVKVLDGITLNTVQKIPNQTTKAKMEAFLSYKREDKGATEEMKTVVKEDPKVVEAPTTIYGEYGCEPHHIEFEQGEDDECNELFNANGESLGKFYELGEPCNGMLAAAIPDSDESKWGYVNYNGEYVIEPVFEAVGIFGPDGLACVCKDGEYYFINKSGQLVEKLNESKNLVHSFADEFAKWEKDGKYGFINQKGEWVIEPKYEKVWNFSDGYCKIKINGKWGIINDKGEVIIEPLYEQIDSYSTEEPIEIKLNGRYGFINQKGEIIIEPKYDSTSWWSNNHLKVGLNGKYGYINDKGEVIIEPLYEEIDSYSTEEPIKIKLNDKYGFINGRRDVIAQPTYDSVEYFKDGLCKVELNGEFGKINLQGEMAVEFGNIFDYSYLKRFEIDGKYGFKNKNTDEVVIEPKFDNTDYDFSETGFCKVTLEGKQGLINAKGEITLQPIYDKISSFSGTIKCVKLNGKYGLFKEDGTILLEPIYDNIKDNHGGLSAIELDRKWGLINSVGKIIIEPKYDELDIINNHICKVKENGKYGLIDCKGEYISDLKFDRMYYFSDGLCKVEFDGKGGFINEKGELAFMLEDLYSIEKFDEGFCVVMSSRREYGLIDKKGNIVIEPRYEKLDYKGHGLYRFTEGDKEGLVNVENEIILAPEYDEYSIWITDNGLIHADENGEEYTFTLSGEPENNPDAKLIEKSAHGLTIAAIPSTGGYSSYGFLDESGEWAIFPQFYSASLFMADGYAVVEVTEDISTVISCNGNIVWQGEEEQGSLYHIGEGLFYRPIYC